ncbi:MAG TPA: hypothetical protein VFH95_05440 [Candidatus Kapabacteria bacterium]|nr:hypothetical protein [Candidatus Kapabacteria bacterium]
MNPHHSRLFFALAALVLVAGCSESVSPSGDNTGIPRGSFEGEYGFSLNGNTYDSGTPFGTEGNASLRPLASQGRNAVQLSISLFFELTDGTYGSVQVSVPLINPQPQTEEISSYTIPATSNATGSIDYDSLGWRWFSSLPGGTITLTKFDTVNNLISGTFNFTASQTSPTANPNNVMRLTSGYFNDIPIVVGSYDQGSVTAVVNGNVFTADTAGREIVQTNLYQGRLNLSADGQGIFQSSAIGIQSIPLTPGTYIIKGPQPYSDTTLSFIYEDQNFKVSTQDTGSIGQLTITKCDIPSRRISGAFQFSGTDTLGNSVTITSGEINNVQWEP